MTYSPNSLAGTPIYDTPPGQPARMGGSDVLRILRRRLGLILLIIAIGMGGTAWWVLRQVPFYSTQSAILLKSSELPTESENQSPTAGVVTTTQVFTEAEVLRSKDFASRLANRLGLSSDPRFNPALVDPLPPTILDRVLVGLGLRAPEADRPLSEERQHAEVISRLLSIYSVSASDQHSVIYIQAYYSDPVLATRIVNETARLYIDMRVAEQLADLDRDIAFMRKRSEEISAGLSDQQTRMTRLMLENQLLDDNAVRALLAEQARLRIRLEASDADTPGRDDLESRIAEVEGELANRVGAEIRLTENQTALHTQTSRLDAINKRLDELEAQRQTPTTNVVQISVADVPTEPAGPNVNSTLAAGFVVFGFLAVVAALLRESLDRRILYEDHIENLTGLNVISALARLPRRMLRRHRAPHLCVGSDAAPGYANAVRALVSAAMDGTEPGRAPVVVISSAKSGEGKSTVAASMAMAAAMDDLRVLLIDFDVHRFGLTRKFGLRRGNVSFGEAFSSAESFAAALMGTGQAGIDLLNFRAGSRMSRRVLRSDPAQGILTAIRSAYDIIIVDTPPFLASEEVTRLHGIADRAILVSRWGKADRETLSQTARLMRRSGLPLIGLAVNAINTRSAEAYGYLAFREDYYRPKDLARA